MENKKSSKKKIYGARNRRLGHKAETYYAKIFRELGYDKCVTSRYGSRLHDDAGIDLINIPFNVQVKAGIQRGLNFTNTLKYVKSRVKELFPSGHNARSNPTIVIHKKGGTPGRKRDEFDELVVMTFNDFLKILNLNNGNKNNTRTDS